MVIFSEEIKVQSKIRNESKVRITDLPAYLAAAAPTIPSQIPKFPNCTLIISKFRLQ